MQAFHIAAARLEFSQHQERLIQGGNCSAAHRKETIVFHRHEHFLAKCPRCRCRLSNYTVMYLQTDFCTTTFLYSTR